MKKILTVLSLAILICTNAFAGEYKIVQEKSELAFIIQHAIGFNSAFSENFSGSISYGKKNTITAIDLTIEMNSINSFNELRDEALKSEEFFDTVTYPNASLKLKELSKDGKKATCDITIKGKTKTYDFDLQQLGFNYSDEKKYSSIRIGGKINREDFGVNYNVSDEEGNAPMLGTEIVILFNLISEYQPKVN